MTRRPRVHCRPGSRSACRAGCTVASRARLGRARSACPRLWMLVVYIGSLAVAVRHLALPTERRRQRRSSKMLSADNYRELLNEPVYRDVAVRTIDDRRRSSP